MLGERAKIHWLSGLGGERRESGFRAIQDQRGQRALRTERKRLDAVTADDGGGIELGIETGARSRDVVGHDEIGALAKELLAPALDRIATFRGKPDQDRVGASG